MFKNKSKEKNTQNNIGASPAVSSGSINSLVSGTNVEGTIIANSDIRIDGSLKGKLDCSGRVIIGPDGSVDGEIKCQNAVIEGTFSGNITVTDLLNVRETANIQGDVVTSKLLVQPGAVYNVSCSMGGQKIKGFGGDGKKSELDVA